MNSSEISIQGKYKHRLVGWKYSVGIRMLLFFSLALIFYLSLFNNLVPKIYKIRVGEASEQTILAAAQIENSEATEQKKQEAARNVKPIFTNVDMKSAILLDAIFSKLEQINTDDQVTLEDKVSIYRKAIPDMMAAFYNDLIKNYETSGSYSSALLAEVKVQINNQQYRLQEEVYFKLPKLTKDELTKMEPVTKDIVRKLETDQITEAQTARDKVAELVNMSQLEQKMIRELVSELSRFVVVPNKFADSKATENAKVQAMAETKPVYFSPGDILVAKGQTVTAEIYKRLDIDQPKQRLNYFPQLGLLIMVSLFLFLLYSFMRQSRLPVHYNNAKFFMLTLIFLLNILGMKIVAIGQNLNYPFLGYLAPVAMGSMLIAILLDAQLAFVSSVIFSIFASVIFNKDIHALFDFHYGFVAAVVCFVSIFSIHRASQRISIVKAGMLVSLFSTISAGSLLLLDNRLDMQTAMISLAFAFAGGLLTAVLVIGLLPFFESLFGILSSLKLVELSNPNHALLRKLLTETPGTYHHSVMVGNLAEAAAESIGANGLLCRVGSYYHDIGKTKRPNYFIENQTNMENPHDLIEPSLSKSIIFAHPRDGVDMLKQHHIPKQIRDIAEQHHGTTLLQYFYRKALQQTDNEEAAEISEQDYRYPGPKAQTKEAAIVGIADCVEAAVRSLHNPSIDQINSMVGKIIKSRLDDQQFNECDLTLREIDTVAKCIQETLIGIFHSRIQYPSDLPNKGEKT